MEEEKLIAVFMGRTPQTDGISWFDENYKPIKYKSWEHLMPVVEKIETTGYDCTSFERYKEIEEKQSHMNFHIGCGVIRTAYFQFPNKKSYWRVYSYIQSYRAAQYDIFGSDVIYGSKLDATYLGVIEFIKWYNSSVLKQSEQKLI